VVGGWHLAPYPDELIAKTVEAMKEINPDYLIPMHCAGSRTIMAIQRQIRKAHRAFHRHARRLRRLAPSRSSFARSRPGAQGHRLSLVGARHAVRGNLLGEGSSKHPRHLSRNCINLPLGNRPSLKAGGRDTFPT
jgi:hypothetical protein